MASLTIPHSSSSSINLPIPESPQLESSDTRPRERVRRNFFSLFSTYSSLPRIRKFLILLTLSSLLIQSIIIITLLILSYSLPCDQPLKAFNIVYLIRILISYPLHMYFNVYPYSDGFGRRMVQVEHEALAVWMDRVRHFADLLGTVWFVVGNFCVFSSNTCQDTNPLLYYLSVGILVLGYMMLAIPIFFCGAVICCLPCVLVLLRMLGVATVSPQHANNALPQESIDKIPVIVYKKSDRILPSTVSSPLPESSIPSQEEQNNAIHISEEDANCVICLCSYEELEELKILPCKHHFHSKVSFYFF